MTEPCTEPLRVMSENGFVIVEGGCGVAVTLTPPAAQTTGGDLLEGSAKAARHEDWDGAGAANDRR